MQRQGFIVMSILQGSTRQHGAVGHEVGLAEGRSNPSVELFKLSTM